MATLSLVAPNPSALTRNAQAATNSLARLLATENIRVEHQPVPTAMFDTVSRTLVLPVWHGMSQDLYDMLVGHEVGHALWTPATVNIVDEAIQRIRAAGAPSDAWAKSILNIVEDARIERLIKEKFPGLRRNFTIAYKELIDRDIFGLAEVNGDPNAKGFVDRFNLYHKCGALGLMQIAFTTKESPIVDAGQHTKSFEDVVVLCERICDMLRQNCSMPEPQHSENGAPSASGGNQEQGEQGEQGEQSASDDANAQGEQGEQGEQPTASQTSAGDNASDDTDETQQDEKSKQPGKSSGLDDGKGRSAKDGAAIGENISTDERMAKGLGRMADTNLNGYYNRYADAPAFEWNRLIVTAEEVIALWRNQFVLAPKAQPLIDSLYDAWKRDNLPTVMNMVKRFEQRKAADDARRTMTTKSGRIDPSRLAYYKVSEDLFLSMTTTTDGKSHGLVMLVDWSGSMNEVLGSVLSQVLCLVEFCRKAGVPYEVYAFSDCVHGWKPGEASFGEVPDADKDENGYYRVCRAEPGRLMPAGFKMVQFLRSGMSRADHADAVRGLVSVMCLHQYEPFVNIVKTKFAAEGHGTGSYYNHRAAVSYFAPKFAAPDALSLNGTPLNEGLLASAEIIEAFRQRTGAQIVNLAVLTDGDSTRTLTVHEGAQARAEYLRDRTGHTRYPAIVLRWGTKQYTFVDTTGRNYSRHNETNAIVRYLRDRTGARVYGFYLMNERSANRSVRGGYFRFPTHEAQQAAAAQLDADGSCIVPHEAYDEYYLVSIAPRTEAEDFMDRLDTSSLSARKIANSFAKGMQNRSTSRTIMVRFTDCFATGKPSQHKMR